MWNRQRMNTMHRTACRMLNDDSRTAWPFSLPALAILFAAYWLISRAQAVTWHRERNYLLSARSLAFLDFLLGWVRVIFGLTLFTCISFVDASAHQKSRRIILVGAPFIICIESRHWYYAEKNKSKSHANHDSQMRKASKPHCRSESDYWILFML